MFGSSYFIFIALVSMDGCKVAMGERNLTSFDKGDSVFSDQAKRLELLQGTKAEVFVYINVCHFR